MYVLLAVIAYRRRPALALLVAGLFVVLATVVGTVSASLPHSHWNTSRFPVGSPIHWRCHTLQLVAFATVLAPVPLLAVAWLRKVRSSAPPRFIEELGMAAALTTLAWFAAVLAMLWVFVQSLGCDTL